MHFSHILAQYGYLALFIGCLLEGETLLILAGFAAHQGYLSFPAVVLLAFCAGTLGDQIFFFIGHFFGARVIHRLPHAEARVVKINGWLRHHSRGLIIAVRFMYGLRVIGPMAIGNSGVPITRFILFNMLGAAIWAMSVASAGFIFGKAMKHLFTNLRHYELLTVLLIVTTALLWTGWQKFRHKY